MCIAVAYSEHCLLLLLLYLYALPYTHRLVFLHLLIDSVHYAPIDLQQAVVTVVMSAAASQLLFLTNFLLVTLVGLVLAVV
jgi:hypothetical protein